MFLAMNSKIQTVSAKEPVSLGVNPYVKETLNK